MATLIQLGFQEKEKKKINGERGYSLWGRDSGSVTPAFPKAAFLLEPCFLYSYHFLVPASQRRLHCQLHFFFFGLKEVSSSRPGSQWELSRFFFSSFFRASRRIWGFGLPGGPAKKRRKFFFFRALLCVVCSINADSTLRYAPLRTTDAPTDYFSEERSGGLFAKN